MKIPLLARCDRWLPLLAFLAVILSVPSVAHGQNPAEVSSTPQAATSPQTPADVNTTVLHYQAALRSAAEQHHRFIQYEIEQLKWVISLTVPIVGAIFVFLNWKGRREIRAQVNARFKTSVDAEIDERLARFDSFLDENRRKIERTDRYVELIDDMTFAFHVLSVRLDDPEWDAARHDAKRALLEQRRELPDSRRLAILLGRLYKHFRDYDAAVRVLTETMAERDRKQMPQDRDYAALLYNRACYQTLNAAKLEPLQPQRARTLRSQAWKDLNFSIALEPENKSEAKADLDLQTLWTEWRKEDLGSLKLPDLREDRTSSTGSWAMRLLRWLRQPT